MSLIRSTEIEDSSPNLVNLSKNKTTTFGRVNATVILHDPRAFYVSRLHAKIVLETETNTKGKQYKLIDLNSTNGTFLNSIRIKPSPKSYTLKKNDIIVFGGGGRLPVGAKLDQPNSSYRYTFSSDTLSNETPDPLIDRTNTNEMMDLLGSCPPRKRSRLMTTKISNSITPIICTSSSSVTSKINKVDIDKDVVASKMRFELEQLKKISSEKQKKHLQEIAEKNEKLRDMEAKQKIMLSKSSKLEDTYECEQCYNVFVYALQLPCCGNAICFSCWNTWCDVCEKGKKQKTCIKCRAENSRFLPRALVIDKAIEVLYDSWDSDTKQEFDERKRLSKEDMHNRERAKKEKNNIATACENEVIIVDSDDELRRNRNSLRSRSLNQGGSIALFFHPFRSDNNGNPNPNEEPLSRIDDKGVIEIL